VGKQKKRKEKRIRKSVVMGKKLMANPCCGLQIAKCQTPVKTLRKEREGITFGSFK
jgi:hypothetical protein